MFSLRNKFYIIFMTLWLFTIYFILIKFHSILNNNKAFENRIEYLQKEVESLEQKLSQLQSEKNTQRQELQNELKHVKHQLALKVRSAATSQNMPTLEYEQLRRKIENQARELSYFTIDQMNKISDKLSNEDKQNWKHVILRYSDQNRVLLAAIRNLTKVDGYQSWREMEQKSLSKLIQARLNALQNPSKPCTDVQSVTHNINENCGFGCQIHHAARSFLISYILGWTMILISDKWNYNPRGFEQIFQPLSQVCNRSSATTGISWARLVSISLVNNTDPENDFLPMAIPEDLSERLIRLHEHPFVWFMGQLMKYLLRPQLWLSELMKKKQEDIKFQTPIVGIHVRRTDKEREAAFHNVSEYMRYVEDYFIIYQYQNPNVNVTKRVYVATDEPTVFKDIRFQYPDYVVYGDTAVAQSAQLDSRYGIESLKGLLLDMHFLSLSDYLVCTFSSQICRAAYEIMQQRVTDGAWRVQSLDDVYYFAGQNGHNQRAVISHKAVWPNEFSFEHGDIISTAGNHWDGFSKGSDKTNGEAGLYPTYKTEEIIKIAKMHTYPEIQIETD